MTSTRLITATALVLFTISAPAWAQMGGPMSAQTGSTADARAKTGAPAMSSGMGMSRDAMPTNCEGMMDKASPMIAAMADGSKKMMAMKHMKVAKIAMSAHKEKTCMSHMKTAMHGMM